MVSAPARAQSDCAPADNASRVSGRDLCFVIKTHEGKLAQPNPALVVFLHGDTSAGGPSDYFYGYAERFADESTVTVALIRPGYFDSARNQSGGSDLGRRDNYLPEYMDAIAAALEALKAHHKARRLVMVGHSGGAATTANILGRHPGLVDAAVLLSCPCNLGAWRNRSAGRGSANWERSLSPDTVIDRIAPSSSVVAAVGENDVNTVPALSRDYVASLAARNIKARLLVIPGAAHNFDRSIRENPDFIAAIREAITGAN
ncbi:MAG: alpha/beta hydrolase family protein [Alphaproteobacteria bacterium]